MLHLIIKRRVHDEKEKKKTEDSSNEKFPFNVLHFRLVFFSLSSAVFLRLFCPSLLRARV